MNNKIFIVKVGLYAIAIVLFIGLALVPLYAFKISHQAHNKVVTKQK